MTLREQIAQVLDGKIKRGESVDHLARLITSIAEDYLAKKHSDQLTRLFADGYSDVHHTHIEDED